MDPGPYSSPKAQSPNVNRTGGLVPSQNESGNLKLSIALGQKGPTIIQKGPFYLVCKDEKDLDPQESTMTGATNLMASKGLEHSYVKLTSKITFLDIKVICSTYSMSFISAKKMKDTLSSFLPQLPGVIDTPGSQDSSALRGLIDKPPGKYLMIKKVVR